MSDGLSGNKSFFTEKTVVLQARECPLLRMRQNYRCSAKYIKKLKILHVKHKNNPTDL